MSEVGQKESSNRITTTDNPLQQFASDGSFLATILAAEAKAEHSNNAPPTGTCSATSGERSDKTHDSAPRRRRRFEEVPTCSVGSSCADERVKRRTQWDTPLSDERSDAISAAEREKRALAHIKDYDPSPTARDTYEDALESGGLIDGGTWEHRKRAKEIVCTSNLSEAINQLHKLSTSAGKARKPSCSLQTYIPSEVLNVVQDKLSVLDTGPAKPASESKSSQVLHDVEEKSKIPIPESNVGYKLLAKSGWSAGAGLGREGQGIKEPIRAVSQTVLGTVSTSEAAAAKASGASEDPFEAYRQRMMLAYRFRPNPLNNPRRSYDGYKTLYDSKVMNTVLASLEKATTPDDNGEADRKTSQS